MTYQIPKKIITKLLVLAILILGVVVRLYHQSLWLQFDYDQELIANFARSVFFDHKLLLIGPQTSVGGIFLGPYYFYIYSLVYWLFKFNPTGAIYLNMLVYILTGLEIYSFGKKYFSVRTGLLALLILSFSALIVAFDRISWNPSPMPLFTILTIDWLVMYLKTHNQKYLALSTVAVGFLFHLHFSAIFIAAFFATSLIIFGGKKFWANPKNYLIIAVILGIFFLPLIIFDFRHEFLNIFHVLTFFSANSDSSGQLNFDLFRTPILLNVVFESILFNHHSLWLKIISTIFMIFTVLYTFTIPASKKLNYQLFLLLQAAALIPLFLYHGQVLPYYLFFLLPVYLLLLARFTDFLSHSSFGKIMVFISFSLFIMINLTDIQFGPTGFSEENKSDTVKFIILDAGTRTFKIDFIANPGRKTGFEYLFWLHGKTLVEEMSKKTDLTYKIVIPSSFVSKQELIKKIGNIGIIRIVPSSK